MSNIESNSDFLKRMQLKYQSLKYFSIVNNYLVLNINGQQYAMPSDNLYLCNFENCENIFLIDPIEIFHILYMYKLINNKEITDEEKSFIEEYVNKYNQLDIEYSKERENGNIDEVTENRLNSLKMPIYFSGQPELKDNTACITIKECIEKYQNNTLNNINENDNGPANTIGGKQLVKTKPGTAYVISGDNDFFKVENEEDRLLNKINTIRNGAQSGFTVLCLVAGAVLITCAYLLYFFSVN